MRSVCHVSIRAAEEEVIYNEDGTPRFVRITGESVFDYVEISDVEYHVGQLLQVPECDGWLRVIGITRRHAHNPPPWEQRVELLVLTADEIKAHALEIACTVAGQTTTGENRHVADQTFPHRD